MDTGPQESLLILPVPAAQPLLSHHGSNSPVVFPAHLTIAYPFKPVDTLDGRDRLALRELFGSSGRFRVTLNRLNSFGDEVLFAEPADPAPIVALILSVQAAFPGYPIYGGAFADVCPHLTVATKREKVDFAGLRSKLEEQLPITQQAQLVQLWGGPVLSSRQSGWTLVESFPLG